MGAPWLGDYSGKFAVSEEEKRDGNTEFTELGTQRAQRTERGKITQRTQRAQSSQRRGEKRTPGPRHQLRAWGNLRLFLKVETSIGKQK